MSNYELLDALYGCIGGVQTVLMNFVAVLFAFLIAGYLVADKLDKIIVIIIVTLFSLVTFNQMLASIGLSSDFAGLLLQLADRAATDPENMGWHSSTLDIREFGLPIMRFSPTVIIVVSYFGGLVFFFRQRYLGRRTKEK